MLDRYWPALRCASCPLFCPAVLLILPSSVCPTLLILSTCPLFHRLANSAASSPRHSGEGLGVRFLCKGRDGFLMRLPSRFPAQRGERAAGAKTPSPCGEGAGMAQVVLSFIPSLTERGLRGEVRSVRERVAHGVGDHALLARLDRHAELDAVRVNLGERVA